MSQARMANRTLLLRGNGAGPEVFSVVPEVARVNFPDIRVDLQDVTSHDSLQQFREYIPGLKDGDNVTAEMAAWVPWNAVHYQLRVDQNAGTKRNYQISLNVDLAGEDNACQFAAYVSSIAPTANIGEVLKGNLVLKVTGALTYLNKALTPALTMVWPSSAARGVAGLKVQLVGYRTNWMQGSTTVVFGGAGITVNSVTVLSGNVIIADISVAGGATVGARNVTATTGAEVVTLAGGLTIT